MASMAGTFKGEDGIHAKCLREKRARNRRPIGWASEQRVLRKLRMVAVVVVSSGAGDVADGAILIRCFFEYDPKWYCGEWYLKK